MDQIGKIFEQDKDKVSVPDLDWLELDATDVNNIPTPNNVQIVPQLQDAWSHTEVRSTELIPNVISVTPKKAADEVSKEAVSDLLRQVKRDMMLGLSGKALSAKIGSLFMPDVIASAKDELIKLASEQGLLGNVYVDMSAFDSCTEAARMLGRNKVRTAQYALGNPAKHCCRSHKNGYCSDLGKKVVASLEYTESLLQDYTKHLRVAGVISNSATIGSKEALKEAFMDKQDKVAAVESTASEKPVDIQKAHIALSEEIQKSAAIQEKLARQQRFFRVRPMLAFMQDQMLRGKIGSSLKESLQAKYTNQDIQEYSPEIKKLASLQGLVGNVYVDISYYRNIDDAVKAIKNASTNPLYLIQSVKNGLFDDSLAKVAKATGCTEFPKNGKIDKSVALSYITDLQFSDRISSEVAATLQSKVASGSNVLSVIRDAFLATQDYKRKPREGGVQATQSQGVSKKAADREDLKKNTCKALEAGISISKLEDKLATLIPTPEAMGMVRSVLSSMSVVDSVCLPRCANDKYQFKHDARIKKSDKCDNCIYISNTACTHLGLKFVGAKDLEKAFLDLDPKTAKVQFKENPDLSRMDMKQEYDLSDSFGSGMNIALDNIRTKGAQEIEIDYSPEGLDRAL